MRSTTGEKRIRNPSFATTPASRAAQVHLLCLGQIVGQRFFAKDVAAGGKTIQHLTMVGIDRRGDHDGVDLPGIRPERRRV